MLDLPTPWPELDAASLSETSIANSRSSGACPSARRRLAAASKYDVSSARAVARDDESRRLEGPAIGLVCSRAIAAGPSLSFWLSLSLSLSVSSTDAFAFAACCCRRCSVCVEGGGPMCSEGEYGPLSLRAPAEGDNGAAADRQRAGRRDVAWTSVKRFA